MKKFVNSVIFALCLLIPFSAFAKGNSTVPELTAISFKNAKINEEFSSDVFDYTITLDDPSVTPEIKSYKINGDVPVFVNYELNETKHQTGLTVTLKYDNGSVIYKFVYSNPQEFEVNSNNLLEKIECDLCEVYPKLNDNDTAYRLYIPSDLTVINLNAVTKDTGAYCNVPKEIEMGEKEQLEIPLTVTASDGSKRDYTLEVVRLDKTCKEVEKLINSPDFNSLVEGELFWQKPAFYIGIACGVAGVLLIFLFIKIAKRLTVKLEDEDETSFFASKED